MAGQRVWSTDERDSLVHMLVRVNFQQDLTNTIRMGYIILGITKELTRMHGTPFTPQEVIHKIVALKERFAWVNWFIGLRGVHYDVSTNKVWISNKYNKRNQRETTNMRRFRENGEPMFKELYMIFVVGKAYVPDYDWLLKHIVEDERLCARLILGENGPAVARSGDGTSAAGGSGKLTFP